MPSMSHTSAGTASTRFPDVFSGDPFRTAQTPSRYRLFGRHAAAVGTVVCTVRHGRITDANEVGMVAAAGAPVIPDALIAESFLNAGEEYVVALRETAAANTITVLRVMIDEVT